MVRHRLLFVIGSLDVGGAERHITQILPALAKERYEPMVYCLSHLGSLADSLTDSGVPVAANPLPPRTAPPLWYRVVRLASGAGKLIALLLVHRPEIIHFFLPQSYLVGGLCSLLLGPKVRLMSRRSLNDYQAKRPWLARIERRLHGHMSMILGNSRAVVRQLSEEGVPEHQLGLIYNGIDLEPFHHSLDKSSMRRTLCIEPNALVLTMVANLIPYKGHSDLIDALAMIKAEMPTPWLLLCLGRDDGIGASLRQRAEDAGVAQNIRWLGSRPDVPEILVASDMGVLCSHEEGFSNAILEGMAASLPMVVTDVGGNAEAVVDGETGYVVPAHQPRALAGAILHMALDQDRRAMGLRGRARVERHFSLSACIDAYEDIYKEVITDKAKVKVKERASSGHEKIGNKI